MKDVLIISDSKLQLDPRVYKQIIFLKYAGYRIISCGVSPSGYEDTFIRLFKKEKVRSSSWLSFAKLYARILIKLDKFKSKFLLGNRSYEKYYWQQDVVKQTIKRLTTAIQKCDLIIANDIPVLPMALKLGQMYQAKVYIDAHEYEPLHYNTKEFNKYYKDFWYYICKKYLPKADYMTTVCAGIAEKYSKEFNVTCGVIINAPYFNKLDPVECSDNKIKLIHHGMAARGRQLENMIYLMDQLDDQFELHFMLVGLDSTYGKELHSKAVNNKIYFHDPVNMEEIPKELNKYDIGLYLLFPESYNQAMALPNKLFEFIQARLAIAIWPSQEMVKIIDTYKNGIYSKDFDVQQMAKILNSLTKKEIMDMKWNSNKAAKELNAEVNRDKLLTIVNNLIN